MKLIKLTLYLFMIIFMLLLMLFTPAGELQNDLDS